MQGQMPCHRRTSARLYALSGKGLPIIVATDKHPMPEQNTEILKVLHVYFFDSVICLFQSRGPWHIRQGSLAGGERRNIYSRPTYEKRT